MRNESRTKPLIGLICRFDEAKETYYLPREYSIAVDRAGGVPVQIPLIPAAAAAAMEHLDAVVLCGSASDVDPSRYEQPRSAAVSTVHPQRDETDFAVLDFAFKKKLPVLGICFGIQSLNVFLGGSLFQHIPDAISGALEHNGGNVRHAVHLEDDSQISRWTAGKPNIIVNSTHHQSIAKLGQCLRVAGRAPDGVIEAVEGLEPDHFLIGVQWHPERIWQEEPVSARLFSELVGAALRRQSAHRMEPLTELCSPAAEP